MVVKDVKDARLRRLCSFDSRNKTADSMNDEGRGGGR